jgi:hypothetical protein
MCAHVNNNYEITTDVHAIPHCIYTCIYTNYTFEGIHPTLRQVPPRVESFSTQTVCTNKNENITVHIFNSTATQIQKLMQNATLLSAH